MTDKIDAATASMIKNQEEKTGKSMDQWVTLVRAMVSHRVKREKVGDVDAELIGWLKEAYLGA